MKRYIAVDMVAIKEHGLTVNEWILLENIHFESNNEEGYCFSSKEKLRGYIGVSHGKIYRMIERLLENKWLKKSRHSNGLKCTEKWIEINSGHTLQKLESKNGHTLQKMENDPPKNGGLSYKYEIKRETPALEEIADYIKEKKLNIEAKTFYDYFEAGNWVDSKGNKVRNWKQKLLTWNSHSNTKQNTDSGIQLFG